MIFNTKSLMLAVSLLLPLTQNGSAGQIASTDAKLEIRLTEKKPAPGLIKIYSAEYKGNIYLHKTAIVTNHDILEVRVQRHAVPEYLLEFIKAGKVKLHQDVNDLYEVDLKFTKEAGQRLATATENHIGKPMAILVSGKLITAAVLTAQTSDRVVIVKGDWGFTKQEAEQLASSISIK